MKQLLESWNKYLVDNNWKYRVLNEAAFSRIVTDYGDRGYVILTSDRSCEAELGLPAGKECSEEDIQTQDRINRENMAQFLSDVRAAGFGYIPTLGGYKEDVVDPETGETTKVDTDKPENSVIVVARPEEGRDHEELKNLGMLLADKYGQDSFFYKPSNEADEGAYWIKPDGTIDMKFDTFTVDNLKQQFYTQMKRGGRHRFTALDENRELVFRVRTSPTSTAEARRRYGEVFLKFAE